MSAKGYLHDAHDLKVFARARMRDLYTVTLMHTSVVNSAHSAGADAIHRVPS
eukprot:m.855504 g.855504  ORF g.855504 m.855504 type:complete len:52 (-) comp59625_c0_seq20:14-169(-)